MACSMVSRWPSCCSVCADADVDGFDAVFEMAQRLLVALQADRLGKAVVKLGDALFQRADLRLVAACGRGLLEAAVDVAEALVHVDQGPDVRPLRHARRELFDRRAQRLHVALAGGTCLHILEAAGKARHVAMQPAFRWRRRRARWQRPPVLP